MVKEIILLGSTGSIGTQALKICDMYNIKINVLVANSSYRLLAEQINKFKPEMAVLVDEKYKENLTSLVEYKDTKILYGKDNILSAISLNSGMVVNAIVGMAGLLPTIAAIEGGKDIALANKETLVCAGDIVMKMAKEKSIKIFPVDSEHSAIFQSLQGYENKDIKKIFLTASGGPFLNMKKEALKNVTLQDALKHPNWKMGKKITIDSATLMNKGLEVIEAVHLFDVKPENIEVVVHKESVLHSALEYEDGSVIGQMGTADMVIPIQYALTYPKRLKSSVAELSFFDYGTLSFQKPDTKTFLALDICYNAIKDGGLMPCVVNCANEEAVRLFLDGKIGFLDISNLVENARLNFISLKDKKNYSVDDVLNTDKIVREYINLQLE